MARLRFILTFGMALWLSINSAWSQHYEDVTETIGIVVNSDGPHGAGAASVDLDDDGWQDLIFTTNSDTLAIYRNLGDFQFELIPAYLEVPNAFMLTSVDYDRDGKRDLFVNCWGSQDHLFRQTGDFVFEDVTESSGLSLEPQENYTHNWFDANNDGWLDLLIGGHMSATLAKNHFYLNNQDGTFMDYSQESGLTDYLAPSMGAIAADFNADGWQDIFMANDRPQFQNQFYSNQGDSTFVNLSEELNMGQAVNAMSNTPCDFNRDGLLDSYISNDQQGNLLMTRSSMDGSFVDVALEAGVTVYENCWGAQAFDFDNDGWEDLFVTTNINPLQNSEGHNHLYHNLGDGTFALEEDEVMETLPLHNYIGLQVDLDNDGYLDMVSHTQPVDTTRFWRNTGQGAHFLEVTLRGTISNPDAVGAQADVYIDGALLRRWVFAGSDYLSQRPFPLHYGLGQNTVVDSLVVLWPSGLEERYYDIPSDMRLKLDEGWNTPPHILVNSSAVCPGEATVLQVGTIGNYEWSTEDFLPIISVETPGWVSLEVTHPQGIAVASDSVFVIIPEPADFEVLSIVNCAYDSLGSLFLDGPDASALIWTDPETPDSLALGELSWSLLDGSGCLYEGMSTIIAPDSPVVSISIVEPTCFSFQDGMVSADISGGVDPQAIWPFEVGSAYAGEFTLEVNDSPSCLYSFPFEIGQPEELELSFVNETSAGGTGTVSAEISGGIEPYTFNWNGEVGASSIEVDGPGTLELTVEDANGCVISSSIVLTSIGEISSGLGEIYPNPCTTPCMLQGPFSVGEKLVLFNLHGQQVAQALVTSADRLDLSAISPGAYLVSREGQSGSALLLIR